MPDRIQKKIILEKEFKTLCNDLRMKGIKKTNAEFISIAMELLRQKFG